MCEKDLEQPKENYLGIITDIDAKKATGDSDAAEKAFEARREAMLEQAMGSVGSVLMSEAGGDFQIAQVILNRLTCAISEAVESAHAVMKVTETHKPRLENLAQLFKMNGEK